MIYYCNKCETKCEDTCKTNIVWVGYVQYCALFEDACLNCQNCANKHIIIYTIRKHLHVEHLFLGSLLNLYELNDKMFFNSFFDYFCKTEERRNCVEDSKQNVKTICKKNIVFCWILRCMMLCIIWRCSSEL